MAGGGLARATTTPRLLVTGFGPFPGALENPTEVLIKILADAPQFSHDGAIRFEVLPVEYAAIPHQLSALGRSFAPDIAIHFGLSHRADGFTLERVARNEIKAETPDSSGVVGRAGPIRPEAGDLPGTLPLDAIHEKLSAMHLPVFWSEDAGGYLCNYVFYHSRGHLCTGFKPEMSGFIHVPPLGAGILTLEQLVSGAAAIIEICKEAAPVGVTG